MPAISICLPNLNNCGYLPELLDSIAAQTFVDWQLVVVDNHSDDGAWELLQKRAAPEPRMNISQAPREGMYANWNNCIRLADGKYVYIATSDDKLAPDCLEKLHAALEAHPECAIAHCPPLIFGDGSDRQEQWWRVYSPISISTAGILDRAHVRNAPFDGFLHCAGKSVILSITQMLIRRDVFSRVGLFPNDIGVVGDFEWQARVGFFFSSIYVPNTWGGWRLHGAQASAANTSEIELAKKTLTLFERALELFVESDEGRKYRKLAGRVKGWARLHYLHGADRAAGKKGIYRALRLAFAVVSGGSLNDLREFGISGTLRAIRNPAAFWCEFAKSELRSTLDWI